MAELRFRKPKIVQAFDKYIDREYYKINQGFIFETETLLRSDRMKEWVEWTIYCETLPDVILVNGEEYLLIPKT
jgi:hypothetical protein